jgi:hypothetical protein
MTLGNIFSGFLLNPLATRKGVRQKPRSDQGVLTVRVGTPRAPPQCLNRRAKNKNGNWPFDQFPLSHYLTDSLPATTCAATATAEATARATTSATAAEPALAIAVAAATTTAAAEPATTTAAANARGRGTCFVHDHGATIKILPVRGRDRCRCFCIGAHLDKAEALAATGHAINDHISRFHFTMRGKHLLQ